MDISPLRFRHALDRFQAIHTLKGGRPLQNFSDTGSYLWSEEGYKYSIARQATAVMQPRHWRKSQIGSGKILDAVIRAIELPDNNLLQWRPKNGESSRVHKRLRDLRSDPPAAAPVEAAFYDLFKDGNKGKNVFEAIAKAAGNRYELLSYLFFVADPGHFLPIRTTFFDRALSQLGLNLVTAYHCSWDNYQQFIEAIREVQRHLKAEGFAEARLLDAHSFCWVLGYDTTSTPNWSRPKARIQEFSGTLRLERDRAEFTPAEDAVAVDVSVFAANRYAAGALAEEAALFAEQDRLRAAGRDDLARRVKLVSDQITLGYDLHSFDIDERDRYIEVKNVSKASRFYLSRGEWLNSRRRANYWFYLVDVSRIAAPRVETLSAATLQQEHLDPVQYLIRYD
jgi:hypothetical protein